jgi:hypothetical protein
MILILCGKLRQKTVAPQPHESKICKSQSINLVQGKRNSIGAAADNWSGNSARMAFARHPGGLGDAGIFAKAGCQIFLLNL